MDLRKGGQDKGLVGRDRFACEGSDPAVFKQPAIDAGVPLGGGGKDAALQGEGYGVELEDGEVCEDVPVGIEELVVENAGGLVGAVAGCSRVRDRILGQVDGGGDRERRLLRKALAGDPLAIRTKKGLGRAALNDGEERLLPSIGRGEIELVEGEECGADDGGKNQHGGHHAVERDASGLHGGEL